MSEEDHKLEVKDGSGAEPDGGRQVEETHGEPGRRCEPGCRLYRWYPPLLVMSTVMAGVFCLMYVTKPVFIEAPVQNYPDQFNVPVYAEQIAKATGEADRGHGEALIPVHLDPGLLSRSVDAAADRAVAAEVPPVGELEPMKVPRASKPLFQPMDPDQMPAALPPKTMAAVPAEPAEAGEEPVPADGGDSPVIAKAEPLEDAPSTLDTEEVKEAVVLAEASDPAEELEIVGPVEGDDDSNVAPVVAQAETIDEEPVGSSVRASLLGEFYYGIGSSGGGDQKHLSANTDVRY